MRLIPKRRRCKNFAPPTLEGREREKEEKREREWERKEGRMSPLSENESPPAAPPHSCIRVMLRAALLIVLRPRYNPAAILSSFPPVHCMIKKFLTIPLLP